MYTTVVWNIRNSTGKNINKPVEVLLPALPPPSRMSLCASCHLIGRIRYQYAPYRDVVLMEKDY